MESFDSLRRQLLVKLAELTDRYGLAPDDYEVQIRLEAGPLGTFGLESWPAGPMSLTFTAGPIGPAKTVRYKAMLESVGVSPETGVLFGDVTALRDALDLALRVVPPQ